MRFLVAVLCLSLTTVINGIPLTEEVRADTCGYASCPVGDPTKLNVHLVCHTHDDVGWLKTVDQYFYGARNNIQRAGVQYILDTVTQELVHDPNRKFIYVEISFFWRWWEQQSDSVRELFKGLVNNGQLEFINGGWCMNDEAAAYYRDIINQMSWGYRFLNDTFGECAAPRIGWQIDPFGHSREQASLFAQMGNDGLFFGRLDYEDKTKREQTKTMEMIWDASSNLGVEADLFTGVLPNGYGPPGGFCFDDTCSDDPIQDDPNLKDYNVDSKVDAFIASANDQATRYTTNHIIMTMGSDFQYQNANTWYKNLDKLIKYVNAKQSQGSNVNVFYSTPSCYLQALNKANTTWSVKTDDFMPYASDPHAYWTGYFTSRAALKNYVRYSGNFLQVCNQLDSLALLTAADSDIDTLKRYQGDAQHHDGVSGTSKQHVAFDYAESLSNGIAGCEATINAAYRDIAPTTAANFPHQEFCHLLNVSSCQISELGEGFAVTVYNPLGHPQAEHVRLPIQDGVIYSVYGPTGESLYSEIVPIPDEVIETPEKTGNATSELVFRADLPALGYNTYFVTTPARKTKNSSKFLKKIKPKTKVGADLIIQNEFVAVAIDDATGLLKSITELPSNRVLNVRQNFYYYIGMNGDNSNADNRASGAYIFRPNGTTPVEIATQATFSIVRGAEVQEIHQTFSPWMSQIIRVYNGRMDVEFEWFVGSIPVGDNVGKEVITRFETDLATNGIFYTDSNGREALQRQRNFRPTWDLTVTEPVAGNYYPLNTFIAIQDTVKDQQLTIVTDRANGGSSITDGQVEVMLHRRLLHDDSFGVGEALNEPGVDGNGLQVRGKHSILVSTIDEAPALYREFSLKKNYNPVYSFGLLINYPPVSWIQNFRTTYTGLNTTLPPNANLLNLEQWRDGSILLRLENYLEQDDSASSGTFSVDLESLFRPFQITSATETTLGANRWLSDVNRLQWTTETNEVLNKIPTSHKQDSRATSVSLAPMQIRTFVVKHS